MQKFKKIMYQAAKLTYADFLNGLASKEEDFRGILYFHLRRMLPKGEIILLNPKFRIKKGNSKGCFIYPDIIIIHKNKKESFVELKRYFNYGESSKKLVNEDFKKLKIYKKKERFHFQNGYLIHFARNFTEGFIKNGKKGRIIEYYFPEKKDKDLIYNKYGDDYYWVPANSYIESKVEWLDYDFECDLKKLIFSLVDKTKKLKSPPIRFYSDILKYNEVTLTKLKFNKLHIKKLKSIIRKNNKVRKYLLSEHYK